MSVDIGTMREGVESESCRMAVTGCQGAHLGLVWVYHNDGTFLDQAQNTRLVFSRYGISWSKPLGTEIFLGTGGKGEWDSGFAIAHTLVPRGEAAFRLPAAPALRLRFHLDRAELFSFWID